MDRRIVIGAYCTTGLVAVIFLGWLAHAYRIDAHAVAFFNVRPTAVISVPKNPGTVVSSTPSSVPAPISTKPEVGQGSDREEMMNAHWLSRINALRVEKNLQPLTFDPRLAATAKVWADQMGMAGDLSHTRPDGKTVHEWVKTYDLPFTARGPGGWNGNFFTENIGRAYADTSMENIQKGLDQVLGFMVDEGPDGDHYRSIFSPDWNRYGGGFYFETVSENQSRIYMTFHYASLQ